MDPRSASSCVNVRQKLLHLGDGQEKASPEVCDLLCREAATCELALDLLLRLEGRLCTTLGVDQPFRRGGAGDELQWLSPAVPNARKRPEFFLNRDVGDAPAAASFLLRAGVDVPLQRLGC